MEGIAPAVGAAEFAVEFVDPVVAVERSGVMRVDEQLVALPIDRGADAVRDPPRG